MRTLFMVFLALSLGILGVDDWIQHSGVALAQKKVTDQQALVDQQSSDISTLQSQIEQLSGQVASLTLQVKPPTPANSAQPLPASTPAPQTVTAQATPAPAPTASPTPTPAQTRTATDLVSEYSGALVIIEGKNAVGSGFLCTMDGHTYVITNAHVLADNPQFKITNITGKVFNIGGAAVAVGHDVVKIEVTNAGKAFEVMTDLDHNSKIGDAVVVLGNPEGAGVVRPVEGKLVGLGPDLVETDAAFVKGNSGSPIIHLATGKVLGVATYLTERKVQGQGPGSVQVEVRRFGYKLDGITQWQPINWQSFYAQSTQLTQMETLSDDFIKMFGNANGKLNFDPTNYQSPALQRSIRQFLDVAKQSGKAMSDSDWKELVRNFLGDLRSVSHADILSFNKNTAYDYFQREVEDQSRFRDDLYQNLSKAMEDAH